MREPCISVGLTGTPGDGGHIKRSSMYTFHWLPKGYGPSMQDRLVCALFVGELDLEGHGLSRGERHPLVEVVASAIEHYMRAHPEEPIGFMENPNFSPAPPPDRDNVKGGEPLVGIDLLLPAAVCLVVIVGVIAGLFY